MNRSECERKRFWSALRYFEELTEIQIQDIPIIFIRYVRSTFFYDGGDGDSAGMKNRVSFKGIKKNILERLKKTETKPSGPLRDSK
jgi:hypothetical protein